MNNIEILTPTAKKILDDLNEVQKKAAIHKDGALVVFAGAGSGKTKIITSRIALLMEAGTLPPQILAVTFTNKAAAEMKERVLHLSAQATGVHIGTFHSACARWLREFAPELGYSSDFTIYDEKDSLSLIKSILKEFNVQTDDEASASDYKAAISKAKTYAWLPSDAEKYVDQYSNMFPKFGIKVYKRYQESLAASNAMDFGDLLLNTLLLLKRNQGVRKILQKRYRYIMVDEYQDTNPTQFELISYLVNENKNLFVVGDDDQSIYSWRGADPRNILNFHKHYPDATVINLEQNYRCTGNIVKAASFMIAHNKNRAEKTLWTANEPGEPIGFILEYNGELEAWSVADQIKQEKARFPYNNIAIFYRTNAQSRQMEEILRREKIPYKIYGALRFYDRAEIKDLLAYIRLSMNANDDVAFNRIVNTPTRGIGAKAQAQILERAKLENTSLFNAAKLMGHDRIPRLSGKLMAFCKIIEDLTNQLNAAKISEIVQLILTKTEYAAYIEKKFPDQTVDKITNIHELAAALADYEENNKDSSLSDWLQDISLTGSEDQSEAGVHLMTLHSAKGLEFKRVFIIGVEENLLPHSNSMDDNTHLEEERRLLYVGITRAREKLTLLCAEKRRVYNNWVANRPSRFFGEIPPDLFNSTSWNLNQNEQNITIDPNDISYTTQEHHTEWSPGSTVSHPTYGKGTIVNLQKEFGIEKATVDFQSHGKKKVSCAQLENSECYYEYDTFL
ncbi:MAG: UvrD-helicase domain-containing protein [Bdellovibrionota bacterium]